MNIKKGAMLTLNQLQFGRDGQIRDKVEIAIQRLKAFEPPDGYFVCFSGGKDSQCVYHLYNPENGWGDVSSALEALESLAKCIENQTNGWTWQDIPLEHLWMRW